LVILQDFKKEKAVYKTWSFFFLARVIYTHYSDKEGENKMMLDVLVVMGVYQVYKAGERRGYKEAVKKYNKKQHKHNGTLKITKIVNR